MLLTSVDVQNYRSLEHVTLDRLSQINVLIGRNNAGKSTVLSALQFLYKQAMSGVSYAESDKQLRAVLTARDPRRQLKYRIGGRPSLEERRGFLSSLEQRGLPEGRVESLLDSPLLQRIEYEFQAPAGQPSQLHVTRIRVQAQDGHWALVLSIENRRPANKRAHAVERFIPLAQLAALKEMTRSALEGAVITPTSATNFDILNNQDTQEVTIWLIPQLVGYFRNAYFFSPFRHRDEQTPARPQRSLAPDGDNLPAVLNYLSGEDRPLFARIEAFVHQAIASAGVLHPRLIYAAPGSDRLEVEITFQAADGFDVHLDDMGGGVEQLLMVATVLATVEDRATLFLEEPELHLHAGAQRYLIEQLRSESRQVFITTHSPVFINIAPPRSLYRVSADIGRTKIVRVASEGDMAELLDDIGARNSDLLLSDAVLFVEGPSDIKTLLDWSRKLGMSLDEHNVSILPMGGGRDAGRHAPIRSELLTGISSKAPVPHLFLLDRDERSRGEVESLKRRLRDHVHLLSRREIENYLLVPRAVLAALKCKYQEDLVVLERLEETDPMYIEQLMHETAEGLYGTVLLKRIRAEIGGLRNGLVPSELVDDLSYHARDADLADRLLKAMEASVQSALADIDLSAIVQAERKTLDDAWREPERRLAIAPGTEILEGVFHHFGGAFDKRRDGPRIAVDMRPEEINPEIRDLVEHLIKLHS